MAVDSLIILTFRIALITETSSIFLNLIMLTSFCYQIQKQCKTHDKTNSKSSTKQSNNDLHQSTINITLGLLLFGASFSFFQGIENWLIADCAAAWLNWTTLFFYVGHRALLLYAFLHRLKIVFQKSSYEYPQFIYWFLTTLIIIYFVAGWILLGIDHTVKYVDIGWNNGYSGTIMCSWRFGHVFTAIRAVEIILTVILVILFLYKLRELHINTMANKLDESMNPETQLKLVKNSMLLCIFRKIVFLTLAAILTTVAITFAYSLYIPLAAFVSLDTTFNTFCVYLMFKFNHKIIKPCFGSKCDRCCCIKCEPNCECRILRFWDRNNCVHGHQVMSQTHGNASPISAISSGASSGALSPISSPKSSNKDKIVQQSDISMATLRIVQCDSEQPPSDHDK